MHESSHSENVASARKVELRKVTETNNLNYPVGAEIPTGCRRNSRLLKSMASKYKELLITKQPKLATEQFLKPKLSE